MSDALLAQFRHRYNQRCSERRRAGFPKVGHYDTWLIDKLQELVSLNHGKLLFPEWSNTSDLIDTPERFGTVPIYSDELRAALVERAETLRAEDAVAFAGVKAKLTPDQKVGEYTYNHHTCNRNLNGSLSMYDNFNGLILTL